MTICEGVDEMRHIVANTTLNFYHDGFQEVREVECLEVALTEDEIAYCESVEDVGPSTSVPGPFTSVPGPSTSWDDIVPPHTCMGIIDPPSRWMSWGDAPDLSTSALGPSTSASGIMNKCIISLILLKYYLNRHSNFITYD
jgi:hypothetical protein